MAMTNCTECGNEISTTAKSCPKCGAVRNGTGIGRKLVFGGMAVVAVLLIMIAMGSSPEIQEKARERDAIELCWKDQGTKSLDPAAQRFVASACEHMEEEFRQKYGVSP